MVEDEGLVVLRRLRAEIVRILNDCEISVIPEEHLDKPVPWLRVDDEVLVGRAGEQITVRGHSSFTGYSDTGEPDGWRPIEIAGVARLKAKPGKSCAACSISGELTPNPVTPRAGYTAGLTALAPESARSSRWPPA